MCQEAEQGIWKPVLGALGVATVFLTIVGNFVFSPKPSLAPTLRIANTGLSDAGLSVSGPPKTDLSQTQGSPRAAQARRVERAPIADLPTKTDETIVTRPVDRQSVPCDTVSDVALADQTSPAKTEPGSDAERLAARVDPPALAEDTPILVSVAEPAPVSQYVPLPDQVALPEDAPKPGDAIASRPIGGPEQPAEKTKEVIVADVSELPPATQSPENLESRPYAVAVASSHQPVVMHRLSHHERKMLRKIAHLEKKQNRLFKDDQSLVCR